MPKLSRNYLLFDYALYGFGILGETGEDNRELHNRDFVGLQINQNLLLLRHRRIPLHNRLFQRRADFD